MKTNEFGQTEAETSWVAKRAAKHVEAGRPVREAIGLALGDLVAFYREMAEEQTPRAQEARKALVSRIYTEARGESAR